MSPHTPLDSLNSNKRLQSLDVFRGATIAAMILVNNPGTWNAVYPPLLHAEWHGWTVTDLIFPFFLFIVGVSVVLAFTKALAKGATNKGLLKKAFQRSAIIFGLGLILSGFPFFTFTPSFGLHETLTEIRIMGVLQRIALCYLAASVMFLYLHTRTIVYSIATILLAYWALMTLVPVPGYGAGLIDDPHANLAAYLDRMILTENHLHLDSYDPEGLLSTFTAIATTLLGVITGTILMKSCQPAEKTLYFFLWGFALVCLGHVWDWFFPVNKYIWTSSYVVLSGGIGMMMFGLCYWLIDIRGYKRFTRPFLVYGVNPLTVFFMSSIIAQSLFYYHITLGGEEMPLQKAIFETLFLPLASEINASLLFAITWIVLWYFVLSYMYKKKIFLKV